MEDNSSDEYRDLRSDNELQRFEIDSRHGSCRRIKNKMQKIFTVKTLKKRLPCLKWIPKYGTADLAGDCIAGLTVSLLIIPQALAYGIVAGLSPNYGLYSAFVGGIVYFLLGSTRELSIGPTAIMSLMTYHYSSQGGADYAVLLCFLAGVIEIFAGIVNLGFFINFISHPVISGFMSAAAVTIATSQLKGLFGLKLKTRGVIDTWYKVCSNISDTIWQDLVLGLSCIIVLSLIKELHARSSKGLQKYKGKSKEYLKKAFFYINVGRNALIVFTASLIAFALDGENQPFTLTHEVTPGIPSPTLPPFSTIINNETMSFADNIRDIGVGVIMVPFIAILDDIAVVSASSKGRTFDVSQEIIALGVINLVGSFFSSIPTTASLSRTAVNITSGVHTPAGGLLTGIIVLVALTVLTPYFRYIPSATLAAVIICAVMHMFDYEILKPLWRTKKFDTIHLLVTFVACLFIGLEWGILLGIGFNLLFMLFAVATPCVNVTCSTFPLKNTSYILVTPTFGVFYPSTMHIRSAIQKAGLKQGNGSLPVVVNCAYITSLDYTSSKGIASTIEDFERREQPLIFLKLRPEVEKTIRALKNVNSYESLEEAEKMLLDRQNLSLENGSTLDALNGDVNINVEASRETEIGKPKGNATVETISYPPPSL